MPRLYERKFDWDEARRLRVEGWSYNKIAAHFGVTHGAVRFACDEAARAQQAEYARQWRVATCKCGARCQRSSYRGERPRCKACADRAMAKVTDGKAYCPACNTWKPLGDFSRSSTRPNRGVHSECRACSTKRRRNWRQANRERDRATSRRAARNRRERVAA